MAEEAASTEGAEGAEGAAGAATTTATATDGGEKMLPQSEVDRIVQDRLARASKGQLSKAEIDELRAKAAKHDEATEASKTELERAQAAQAKAEERATAATKLANDRLIMAEATRELAKAGVQNVEGALRALDTTGLTVEDDGAVSGVEDAIKDLLEQIPEFVGKAGQVQTKVDQGARGGAGSGVEQVTEAQLENMSPEAITKATREGRMANLLNG